MAHRRLQPAFHLIMIDSLLLARRPDLPHNALAGARLGLYTPIKTVICGENSKPSLEMKVRALRA